MNFNQEQQTIINSIYGAYLVSAPVGTGKTTVLSERVLKAIELGIKPEEILCLTFTNKAAEEMRNRIKTRINEKEKFDEIVISTFHGFCSYFIKAEAKQLGVANDFLVIDEDDQIEIIKDVIKKEKINLEVENTFQIKDYIEKIYKSRLNNLEKKIGCQIMNLEIDNNLKLLNSEYQKKLKEENVLDFSELVLITMEALYFNEELKNKWTSRFKFIQLDEFQDTHLSEYLVVKQLARVHKNLSFIGDLDQTIYSWRGSDPVLISKIFKEHFKPVQEIFLLDNYRSSIKLLKAIEPVLDNMNYKHTKEIIGQKQGTEDNPIEIIDAYNFSEEISQVVHHIKKIREKNEKASIAVLARTHNIINLTAEIFSQQGIAHITVDQYNFFRRQEVRDIYAYLKIIFNKYDTESAYRIVSRPKRNIGETTLTEIREQGGKFGLRISDFFIFDNFLYQEPFEKLLNTWKKGRIVVLDTETTGTNTNKDEIIQIYAREVINGVAKNEFHHYIKNTIPVGTSEAVHRISDEFLLKKGEDTKEILKKLQEFIGNSMVVGHNVNFDLAMIVANGKRSGINFEFKTHADTLDLSRRLVESTNYKLNTLAQKFNLETATHSADDDVNATIGLLSVLIEKLKQGESERKELFGKYKKKFIKLAGQIKDWEMKAKTTKPVDFLEYIFENSGLEEYYGNDHEKEKRFHSYETLKKLFTKKYEENETENYEEVLRDLINYSSLVKNIDFLGLEKGKIPIVTVHQVKGLEFDYVFLISMNEYKFPSYASLKSNDLEEEKRLFYVALTRAKQKVFLSYSNFDNYNRTQTKSRFLGYLKV